MDTQRPHAIVPERELTSDKKTRARFMPLSTEDHATLAPMTPDQRHQWLKDHMPTKERLARHLEAEGLPQLAYHARRGLYDDFDDNGHETPQIKLMADLKKAGRFDLKWIVTSGEYDATKSESDAWAARQTGEMQEILDVLKLRGGDRG